MGWLKKLSAKLRVIRLESWQMEGEISPERLRF